jgi:acyl dehydratase
MKFDSLDMLATVGSVELGMTAWQCITHEHVKAFADLTGDHQWIHLDEQRAAAESPFGSTIVHGAHILALVPVFVGALFDVAGVSHIVNAGLDRARLRSPVPVGSSIRGRATLISVEPFTSGLLARVRLVVEIKDEARPACSAEQQLVFHA